MRIPISGNITHLSMPKSKLGLNVKTARQLYKECKLTVRRILTCSKNAEARKLYEITTQKNITSDSIVNRATEADSAKNQKLKSICAKEIRKENQLAACYFQVFSDIDGFENPPTLFKSRQHNITHLGAVNTLLHRARPDIVVKQQNRITAIELTCPYETNAISSREYKQKRYENLRCELLTPPSQFDLILLEISRFYILI